MFARKYSAKRLPSFLVQLKCKQPPRLQCGNCQQSLSKNSPNLEQPYLWSPEFLLSPSSNKFKINQGVNKLTLDENCPEEKLFQISNGIYDLNQPSKISQKRKTIIERLFDERNTQCHPSPPRINPEIKDCNKLLQNKKTPLNKIKKPSVRVGVKARSGIVFRGKAGKNNCYLYAAQSDRKVLNTSKNTKTNKLPRAEELALERIADQVVNEWPVFFSLPVNVSSCSEQIYFDNTVLKIRTRGVRFYKLQALLFKWVTKSLWAEPLLQILHLTKHAQENTIKIRWQVSGKPRVLYPLELLGKTPSLWYLDYFSILYVGEDEKVAVHHLTKVVPTHKPQRRNPLQYLLALLGLSGTKMDIPSLQEEPVIPSSGGSN